MTGDPKRFAIFINWVRRQLPHTSRAVNGRDMSGHWPYYSVKYCCLSDVEHANRIAEDRC